MSDRNNNLGWWWYYTFLAAVAFLLAAINFSVHQWGPVLVGGAVGIFALVRLWRVS